MGIGHGNHILSAVEEIKETHSVKEVAQLLSSGNWVAICATSDEPYCFCLGRVKARAE